VLKKFILFLENRKREFFECEWDFYSIGNIPSTSIAKSTGVSLDERGFIMLDKEQKTNISGVFAAGGLYWWFDANSQSGWGSSIAGISAL